ncbi:hypothetical protein SIAM614_28766 [Stappia aggregata IAM 12614]
MLVIRANLSRANPEDCHYGLPVQERQAKNMVTLNARVGAVALVLGSCGTAALSFLAPDLTPLRLLSFAVVLLGSWAFADEMGIRKPLNRAGLVAIAFAGLAKTLVLLGADPAVHR